MYTQVTVHSFIAKETITTRSMKVLKIKDVDENSH